MSSNTTVYVGFWTNWSKGPVSGATLTLSNRNAAVLIAALAIFIQLTGGQSWSILCFVIHQLRVSRKPKNGLYHQQQATLRNSSSDIKTIWQLVTEWWAWRSVFPTAFRNSITLILIGFLHLLAFSATGILASHITTTDNQVLMSLSPACGPWKDDFLDGENTYTQSGNEYNNYFENLVEASKEYVQSCINEPESLPECDRYKKQKLNFTSRQVPCPFQDLCLGPPNNSLAMDSGFLDSRDDFGINARDNDRVQVRITTTCSPITTEGYTKSGTTLLNYQAFNKPNTFGQISVNYTASFYGTTGINNTYLGFDDPALANSSWIYTNFREVATTYYNEQESPYDIHIDSWDWPNSYDTTPIPALAIENSTISTIYAAFYGAYTGPSDDLWLAAHQLKTFHGAASGDYEDEIMNFYVSDQPFSVLACVEQWELCSPPGPTTTPRCTAPASQLQISTDYLENNSTLLRKVLANERQVATAGAISMSSGSAFIQPIVYGAGTKLLASSLATTQVSLQPSPNQWILESENWFQTGLAAIQAYMVGYVSGPPREHAAAYSNQSNFEPGLEWLCTNQIIRRSDYTNFSTLAIALVFGIGVIVIATSLCLETIVGYTRLRRRKNNWKQRAWWSEGSLQLQRRAFEGMGVKDWKIKEWDLVPVTSKGIIWSALRDGENILPLVEEAKSLTRGSEGNYDRGSAERESPQERRCSLLSRQSSNQRNSEIQVESAQQLTTEPQDSLEQPEQLGQQTNSTTIEKPPSPNQTPGV